MISQPAHVGWCQAEANMTTTDRRLRRTTPQAMKDREAAVELAFRPWRLIGEGRVADGLALLDDAGTWWEMASRSERPMAQMKAVLAEILAAVPMTFELIGS